MSVTAQDFYTGFMAVGAMKEKWLDDGEHVIRRRWEATGLAMPPEPPPARDPRLLDMP